MDATGARCGDSSDDDQGPLPSPSLVLEVVQCGLRTFMFIVVVLQLAGRIWFGFWLRLSHVWNHSSSPRPCFVFFPYLFAP